MSHSLSVNPNEVLTVRAPATGSVITTLALTQASELSAHYQTASNAQSLWKNVSVKKRAELLIRAREVMVNELDDLIELISLEAGKPKFEALANEIIPSLDLLTFYSKSAPKRLKDRSIRSGLMKHRKSTLNYWPLGVVAVISPWNYPFLLPFGEIVMALVSGNAVLFKPSEVTPLTGLKIQEIFEKAGLPKGLLQTLIGKGDLGQALIASKPAKIFFTGSVPTGKKIMAQASESLTPVNLELGGKDAMIVMQDADLDLATSAAAWGGFSNSGQMCASVERILVHHSIEAPFTELLKSKLKTLRQGDPRGNAVDLGVVTFENQKEVYESQIAEAKIKGAEFVMGGDFRSNRKSLEPTIVRSGPGIKIEDLKIYQDETFGPVVALTSFRTTEEAIGKANHSRYGLLASVFSRDLRLAYRVARELEAGTVTINEVSYTAGLAETPWGGIKESGIGRTHSEEGLMEFVNLRHLHGPRTRFTVMKAPWWFPYTPFQFQLFRQMTKLYHRNLFNKLAALPGFIWSFILMTLKEKRL